jgi:hypothetical protein
MVHTVNVDVVDHQCLYTCCFILIRERYITVVNKSVDI